MAITSCSNTGDSISCETFSPISLLKSSLFFTSHTVSLVIFSLLADSYGSYPSGLLVPPSYTNPALPLPSPREVPRRKVPPMGHRGRSTSAPDVSFVNTGTPGEVCVCDTRAQLQCLHSSTVCVFV